MPWNQSEQGDRELHRTCGPVVNVPVVAGLVDEPVVEVQLLLAHAVQVLLCKEAGKRTEKDERG